MREIKFRVWDKNNQEWYFQEDLIITPYGIFEGYHTLSSNQPIESPEVSQYTGLKDKNGVEIYEGDIIKRFIGYRSIVVFRNNGFCLETNGTYDWFGVIYGEMEVIGNIYENQELLTAKE